MLYTYSSVDAVPRRMGVKAHAIYTPGCENTWESRSPITGRPSYPAFSHLNYTGHSANFDDFKILPTCSKNYELTIHENLLISKLKPSLNVQSSSMLVLKTLIM